MKLMAYILRGLLLLLLPVLLSCPGFAQEARQGSDMNALVITFSPPFSGNMNRSENLFLALMQTMQEKPEELAARISAVGAIWSVNHNLNGVQFALFYPGNSDAAVGICRAMLTGLAGKIPEIQASSTGKSFKHHLHNICRAARGPYVNALKPVSLYSPGLSASIRDLLLVDTELFSALYEAPPQTVASGPLVIPTASATLYEIFFWNSFSAQSFLSAKFVGERFINEMGSNPDTSYEILTGERGLSLALMVSGPEEELFSAREKLRQFVKLNFSPETLTMWQSFAARANRILLDDQRDLSKKSLSAAWVQHWNGDFSSTDASESAFTKPSMQIGGVSQPEAWKHDLSFSQDTYPRFCSSSLSDSSEIADIAISFVSSRATIDYITESIGSDSITAFPLSLDRQSPDRLTIYFHCPVDQISGCIARLRSRISSWLFEKGLANDLSENLKVGIAGACKIEPLELRGLMQQGWPPLTSAHEWLNASESDLAAAMLFNSNDQEALKRRWTITTATSRGKAGILSMLAARSLMLKSLQSF